MFLSIIFLLIVFHTCKNNLFICEEITIKPIHNIRYKHDPNNPGGNSQNFLKRILKIFVNLGLKILILFKT